VSGASEIVAAERERAERHVDVVKVMARGGMMTAGTDVFVPQFSIEELRLLVEQSHAAGLPVTAHAHAAAAVDQAVAVGVDGIEHATYLVRLADRPGPGGRPATHATDEQLAALAASGIPVGPTLGGFTTKLMAAASPGIRQRLADAGITPEALVEMRMSILRQMTTFGLGFISGADAGIGPAKAHGRYAEAVIELGPVTGTVPALVAASSGAAAAIGLGRSKGRLHRGYDADVLVVRGQPGRRPRCPAGRAASRATRPAMLPPSGCPEAPGWCRPTKP
jgi:imidazolonepropionase-like amidohydrolase